MRPNSMATPARDAVSNAAHSREITVFGAAGHTGCFVVRELQRRGWEPILSGRDGEKLKDVQGTDPELEIRVASVDDPASLDKAISGAKAVINCAGPFGDTAPSLMEAALRARIHYLDVTASAVSTTHSGWGCKSRWRARLGYGD
jgi:short subunit dehydrogenase-like uncharacterized protein